MPMNMADYHPDWRNISRQIREQAGQRCEGTPRFPDCRAENGRLHPETGSRVVLTVAHMGLPMALPFHLHVTRAAQTDEVVNLVGFGMMLYSKSLEWNQMMHDRSIAEFARGATAPSTPFVIALPSTTPGLAPRGAVIPPTSAVPIWIVLTSWSLGSEPLETTGIIAEPAAMPQVIPADFVFPPTRLASASPQPALRLAEFDESAFVRTGLSFVAGLRNGQREYAPADNACFFGFAATGRAANAGELFPSAPHAASLAETDARTRFTQGVVGCGCWEYLPANYTGLFEGANTWACHTTSILYHVIDNKMNNDPCNLRALCQRCHLDWDLDHHMSNARRTRAEKRRGDMLSLPLEIELR